ICALEEYVPNHAAGVDSSGVRRIKRNPPRSVCSQAPARDGPGCAAILRPNRAVAELTADKDLQVVARVDPDSVTGFVDMVNTGTQYSPGCAEIAGSLSAGRVRPGVYQPRRIHSERKHQSVREGGPLPGYAAIGARPNTAAVGAGVDRVHTGRIDDQGVHRKVTRRPCMLPCVSRVSALPDSVLVGAGIEDLAIYWIKRRRPYRRRRQSWHRRPVLAAIRALEGAVTDGRSIEYVRVPRINRYVENRSRCGKDSRPGNSPVGALPDRAIRQAADDRGVNHAGQVRVGCNRDNPPEIAAILCHASPASPLLNRPPPPVPA